MDPRNGMLYPSREAALVAGVPHPVEIIGRPVDIERVSQAVRAQKKARRKAAKASRRKNRR